jgi:hypothetical protein
MEELTISLQSLGFTKSIADSNLYIKIAQNHHVILGWYVPYRKGKFDSSD